ncbi:MAG: 2'-5' RNA ligase family protein, partial [Leptospira sp.]|nr:2'-5' RNA ligase family protein [Leptospira sp.]
IKVEIAEKYNSKEALKPPPHITLVSPFFMDPKTEDDFGVEMQAFTFREKGFQIGLKNFGHFGNHTIFLNIKSPGEIQELNNKLSRFLRMGFNFPKSLLRSSKNYPHMTVAYRDLQKKFKEAWTEFHTRNFEAEFPVESIFLLKHDFKKWNRFKELGFGSDL